MRRNLSWAACCGVAAWALLAAHAAHAAPPPARVFGTFDPITGRFTAFPDTAGPATSTVAGKLTVHVTLKQLHHDIPGEMGCYGGYTVTNGENASWPGQTFVPVDTRDVTFVVDYLFPAKTVAAVNVTCYGVTKYVEESARATQNVTLDSAAASADFTLILH